MPLDPYAVYRYRDKSHNFVYGSAVAMGVKPVEYPLEETGEMTKGVQFVTNTERPHYILGDPKDTEDGVQIVDKNNIGDDGQPVVWEFTPLTMAAFDDMGPGISGYKELRQKISDEQTLHTFFIENFLPDDWLDDVKEKSATP
jgi:hypothetical protein